ncbi:RecQ family zinc-binding domain-containing protein [Andreprevotia sp. IGB-42]|uniref:RecQ family zinc-binding domain-containing protein n=1 Tax=Andreprevotia sp. IGB-42 TaxID=2497473 RepID=UPI0035B53BD2
MGKARFEVIVAALRADGLLEQLGDEVRTLPVADRASRLTAVAAGFVAASEQDREKLAQMMHYAQNAQCRWHFLLAYFGEPAPFDVCGHCDNCLAAQQVLV